MKKCPRVDVKTLIFSESPFNNCDVDVGDDKDGPLATCITDVCKCGYINGRLDHVSKFL